MLRSTVDPRCLKPQERYLTVSLFDFICHAIFLYLLVFLISISLCYLFLPSHSLHCFFVYWLFYSLKVNCHLMCHRLICWFLSQNDEFLSKELQESIIIALTPLLEKNHPTQEICEFFSKVPSFCTFLILTSVFPLKLNFIPDMLSNNNSYFSWCFLPT